jgi:NAD(P)-dependent dehydrogenase (short-subunit alcohol dehydrogenase family)
MKQSPFTLEGQTILVVGASSGIGAATAVLASELGAQVVLCSRTQSSLESVRATLARPDDARSIAMDYLDPSSVREALSSVRQIDHVLVSAAADENKKRGAFLELSENTMRASFDKFWGQVNVARAAVPKMSERG